VKLIATKQTLCNNTSRKLHLITREYISHQLLVTLYRLPWSCAQRRTKHTEVTTDGHNPPGHNPHCAKNSQTLPWNIFHNKIHFSNYLNHSYSSNQNSNSHKFTSNIHKPNPIQLDQEPAQGLTNFFHNNKKKKKNERSKIESYILN